MWPMVTPGINAIRNPPTPSLQAKEQSVITSPLFREGVSHMTGFGMSSKKHQKKVAYHNGYAARRTDTLGLKTLALLGKQAVLRGAVVKSHQIGAHHGRGDIDTTELGTPSLLVSP